MFNALKYTKQLEQVGLSREQAETHVQMISEVMESNLATKNDLQSLEKGLQNNMVQLEYRMTIKLGAMIFAAVLALAKLANYF